MDPAATPLGEKKPRFDADDLLLEIIVRVGIPTTLVRAALVCKRWLGHIADRDFLSRFRKLHPPCLLGFFVTERPFVPARPGATCFVPMPLLQPPELATAIGRLQSYDFGTHRILRCRNGSIFTECDERYIWVYGVHRPLCAEMQIVPPPPCVQDHNKKKFSAIVSKDEGGGLSYLYMLGKSTEEAEVKSTTCVYALKDGAWSVHTSATCLHAVHSYPKALLVDNKIYLPTATCNNIVVLDLTASSFSTIRMPQGVEYRSYTTRLSPAVDASSVYLIHVKDSQLHIWLHKGGEFVLADNICLHETFANLDHTLVVRDVRISQVGDDALFVFLEMRRWIFYLDVKCRTMSKVFDMRY
ncbi:unnamed protein product [Alopecurus aequalis]